jgi:hypothetical protein
MDLPEEVGHVLSFSIWMGFSVLSLVVALFALVIVVHPRVERGWLIWLSGLYVCQDLAIRNRKGFYTGYAILPGFLGIHLSEVFKNGTVA